MKPWIFLLSMVALSRSLYGGVDQGNPKRVIYNMVNDYKLSVEPEWTEAQLPGGVIRLDVHLTYRNDGFFVITKAPPEIPAGMEICGRKGMVYWIGKDCTNAYFVRQFEKLESSVETVVFPKLDGGTR